MPHQENDAYGNFPDESGIALLLIDVISEMDFEGSEQLLQFALPAARRIAALKRRAETAGIPVIYANDNFGRWRSDFREVIERALSAESRGKPIAELLHPGADDYFVLKPKHSAFFDTTLSTLLHHLGTRTLILTGFSGNMCVLFTAIDAYMRNYRLVIPSDCAASLEPESNAHALDYMQRVLDADTRPASDVDFGSLASEQPGETDKYSPTAGP